MSENKYDTESPPRTRTYRLTDAEAKGVVDALGFYGMYRLRHDDPELRRLTATVAVKIMTVLNGREG